MLEALKTLFENNVVSAEIKESIEKAWTAKVNENREQVAQQLREEFAQKYEHDKSIIVEAVDRMISEQLAAEIIEFTEDRKQLAEAKVKYVKKMKDDSKLIKEFVTRSLASEIKELHESQVEIANNFKKLENFIIEALAQEITEFYKDKKDLAETKVRVVREGREHLAKVKEQFIKKSAKLVEEAVNKNLKKEIVSLKEDIETARRVDFGRRLFEAFAAEYQTSYLNEKSEAAKLQKEINQKESIINEAAKAVAEAEKLIERKEAEIRMLKESAERAAIMQDLLAPLSADQKSVMSDLMVNVKTSKLTESFEKYLPTVISNKPTSRKPMLVEAKEVTGNRTVEPKKHSDVDESICDIRRLAGLKI